MTRAPTAASRAQRVVVMQPTRGLPRYMVFLPDHQRGGAREIGFVERRDVTFCDWPYPTKTAWQFQRRDGTVCGLAFDLRREATDALVAEFVSDGEPAEQPTGDEQ